MKFADYDLINNFNLFSDDSNFLYRYKDGKLLKVVPNSIDYYVALRNKSLNSCNLPIDIYEMDKNNKIFSSFYGECIITIPLLVDYVNMDICDAFLQLQTMDLLKLLKKQMLSLKTIHNSGVFHGDISVGNILISHDLDFKFIDFDLGVVDSYISVWNRFKGNYYDIISSIIDADKLDLLFIYLKHFLGIKQYNDIDYQKFSYLLMPNEIIKSILNYKNNGNIPKDYYFIDMIDYLIDSEYVSPFVYAKTLIK